jgi:hypothetical protein
MNLFKKKQSNTPRRRLAEHDERVTVLDSSNIFKRNRTLTGTTSNHLGATNVKSDLESPRAHAHYLANKRRKIFSVLMIILLSAACVWILISHFTAVATVSVSDASISKSINSSSYEQVIQDYLSANPVGRLRFLLDQSALSTYVASKLPEVKSVTQQNNIDIGKTNFIITMRVPVAGWKINGKQYYVDSDGISFEKNYFMEPTVQIVDNSGISPQTGVVVASKRFLSFVGRVVSVAKASGYAVTQATLPVNTTRQLEISLKGYSYPIKLSIDRPVGEQVEDMIRAVQYFASHGQTPSYIDVRVSNKAFYE